MASEPFKCPSCGAELRTREGSYCAYCGTVLPRDEASASESRRADKRERFSALRDHSDLPRLASLTPSTGSELFTGGGVTVFALIFLGVAGWMASKIGQEEGFPSVVGVVILLVIGVGLFVLGKGVVGTARFASAPLRRERAIVVDERTKVTGGSGEGSGAHTLYFVTLELEDGTREELRTRGSIAGGVAAEDMGVAYVKADRLVGFERVDV